MRPALVYRLKRAALLGVLIGAWGAFLALPSVGVGLDLEENIGLKWLFLMRGPIEPPPGVVIVNTSTDVAWRLRSTAGATSRLKSCLDALDGYVEETWPRCLHAALVDNLQQRGVKAIAFDIAFEDDDPDWDSNLAAMIASAGNVVLQRTYQTHNGETAPGRLAKRLAAVARGSGPWILPKDPSRRVDRYWTFNAELGNAPTLPVMALQICSEPLLPTLFRVLGRVRPQRFSPLGSLGPEFKSMDLFKLMQDIRYGIKERPEISDRILADVQSATDQSDSASVRCLIALIKAYGGRAGYFAHFYGPLGTIPTFDGDLILAEESLRPVDPFKDAVVFVGVSGTSMMGQRDAHYTVFSRTDGSGIDLTGVEIAATAFANLLTDRPIRQLSNYQAFISLLAFGFLVGAAAYGLPGLSGSIAGIALGIGYAALALFQFKTSGTWFFVVIPLLVQLPLALFSGSVLQYLGARRERANIRRAMQYYVPKGVADSAEQSGSISHGAEMIYGVCLTTDIEGFTAVSQQESPQWLASSLNKYYDLVSEPVAQHGCDIFDFTADRMMCVWSSSQQDRKVRLEACLAALEIRDRVDEFNRDHPMEALPTRIGLNAGRLALANIGGGGRGSYSPVGEVPNGAERVEGLNKLLKTRLLASGEVVEGLDELTMRRIGSFIPYGMLSTLRIFEIIGPRHLLAGDLQERCAQYEAALNVFETGNWIEAMTLFDRILAKWPGDGPAAYLREKSRAYASAPPTIESPWVIRVETK